MAKTKPKRKGVSRKMVIPAAMELPDDISMPKRLLAAERYITSMDGITVPQLVAQPAFQGVSLSNMMTWQNRDRWVERRKEWLEKYSRKLESAIGTKIVQARLSEMALLERMKDALDEAALEKLPNGAVRFTLQPKTLEGYVRARLDLSRQLDDFRVSVGDTIIPQMMPAVPSDSPEARPTNLHPNLRLRPTDDEARAMIKALLDLRQQEQEKRMAAYEAMKQEVEAPLQVEAPKKKRPPPRDPGDDEETEE